MIVPILNNKYNNDKAATSCSNLIVSTKNTKKRKLKTTSSITSKLSSQKLKNEFYRYYAGFPIDFAQWALCQLKLPERGLVLDPWNGSATTAAACALTGLSCHGYDLNPVMVHLGRARIASDCHFQEAEELVSLAENAVRSSSSIDLRTVGLAFQEIPAVGEYARSVAIAALFPYARHLLNNSKTKNPSWFKKNARLDGLTQRSDELFIEWRRLIQELSQWRSFKEDKNEIDFLIERGDSRSSLGRKEVFDGLLTSPPYLTRLDYVQATLPEFLLLSNFEAIPDIHRLRRSMLGSPLTSERPQSSLNRLPKSIQDVLEKIEAHPSKASGSYYYRFFSTYFVDLQASMRSIAKVMKPGALGCMVVQSSNYKEIEIDLAESIISIGEEFGLGHKDTFSFYSGRSISLINTRAHEAARKPKSESAVFFRKE